MNFDNLFIIGMQQNLCTENDIKAFDALPFEHKVMFSTLKLPLASNIYIPEFAGSDSVGDPLSQRSRLLQAPHPPSVLMIRILLSFIFYP